MDPRYTYLCPTCLKKHSTLGVRRCGWIFAPPFFCSYCGVEMCHKDFGQGRSCEKCKRVSQRRKLPKRKVAFSGPRTKIPEEGFMWDIPESDFINILSSAEAEPYPFRAVLPDKPAHKHLKNKSCGRNSLLKKYGIDQSGYETMYQSQEGKCAVCQQPFPKLNVDHCHTTGKVRKLLCSHCNSALGFVRGNPEVAANLVKYILEDCRI